MRSVRQQTFLDKTQLFVLKILMKCQFCNLFVDCLLSVLHFLIDKLTILKFI